MAVTKPIEEKRFIFTSKLVEEVTDKINDGVVVKRYQRWKRTVKDSKEKFEGFGFDVD